MFENSTSSHMEFYFYANFLVETESDPDPGCTGLEDLEYV